MVVSALPTAVRAHRALRAGRRPVPVSLAFVSPFLPFGHLRGPCLLLPPSIRAHSNDRSLNNACSWWRSACFEDRTWFNTWQAGLGGQLGLPPYTPGRQRDSIYQRPGPQLGGNLGLVPMVVPG